VAEFADSIEHSGWIRVGIAVWRTIAKAPAADIAS
jgi:hypothetical protein